MKSIADIDFRGKRVFLRVDFNVPLRDGAIANTARIEAALPTIRYILDREGKLILASHLGRPKGKREPKLSLAPVATVLGSLIDRPVPLAPDCVGAVVEQQIAALPSGGALLLENLRFHPGEEANDGEFCRALARFAEVYVNDAFGTAHRAHASTAGMARLVPERAAGFLLRRECDYLSKVLENPERPVIAILGGAKVSDKIAVLANLLTKVDALLIGGAMAFTFLTAEGVPVGDSRFEADRLEVARDLLQRARKQGTRLVLPVDHRVSASAKGDKPVQTATQSIPEGLLGVDIGPQTEKLFAAEAAKARTIFWNGPMGIFEVPAFSAGTLAMVDALARSSAVTIVGGGDSAAAVKQSGKGDRLSHISTGGGAALEFLEGRTLPGLAVLEEAQ